MVSAKNLKIYRYDKSIFVNL